MLRVITGPPQIWGRRVLTRAGLHKWLFCATTSRDELFRNFVYTSFSRSMCIWNVARCLCRRLGVLRRTRSFVLIVWDSIANPGHHLLGCILLHLIYYSALRMMHCYTSCPRLDLKKDNDKVQIKASAGAIQMSPVPFSPLAKALYISPRHLTGSEIRARLFS